MTTPPDIRTLLLVITVILLCRAGILLYVWRVARKYPPIKFWAIGSSLVAAGVLSIGLRGAIPDFASILIAQALTIAGWMIVDGGTVLAADHPPPWRAGIALTVVAVLGVAWYSIVMPDFALRSVVVTVPAVAFDAYAAIVCLRFAPGPRRTTFRILAGLLILLLFSNLVKAAHIVASGSSDMFEGAWQLAQFYGLSLVSVVVGTVIFVLLAAQRVQEELDLEIREHQKDKRAIARSEAKYRQLFDATSDAVLTLNQQRFTACNGAALRMFGCKTEAEFCSYTPAFLSPPLQPDGGDSSTLAQQHIEDTLRQGKHHFEWVHRRADNGETFTAEVHLNTITIEAETAIQATVRDISERKRMEDSIRKLAFIDALTQLPNRRLLVDRLAIAMSTSKRTRHYCGLLFIDLDNFKPLNDAHGHDIGDLLLVEVANRLRGSVRAMDTVARFGGDEFVVLIGELSADQTESRNAAAAFAAKLLALLALPYSLKMPSADDSAAAIAHRCSASIGGTLFVGDSLEQDEILRQTDRAMYAAKHAGRNAIRFFEA